MHPPEQQKPLHVQGGALCGSGTKPDPARCVGCRAELDASNAAIESTWRQSFLERDHPSAINRDEHQQRHALLHQHLDELVADFIDKTGRRPSETTLMDFMESSGRQVTEPE